MAHSPAMPTPVALPGISKIVAIGSGKGGVGKTTVAVNLAIALSRLGQRVGLIDADIYGPNVPLMMGSAQQPKVGQGNTIEPNLTHGVKTISIGYISPGDKPLVMRGPMLHQIIRQFLQQVDWGELDYLIVDLPPGTGDVPLTLCQLLPLTGAVVVATPQQVALDDAIRAVRMFEQLQTSVLGIVENMSYFVAPDGSEHDWFGRGGAEAAAKRLNVPFLGSIPIYTELRVNSDAGTPEKNFETNPGLAQALLRVVENLAGQISRHNLGESAPELNIS